MTDENVEVIETSGPRLTVHFERKLNLGDYNSATMSAWVSADAPEGASDDEVFGALQAATNIAKALVYDNLGLKAERGEDDVIREVVAKIERAFPGTTDVTPSAPAAGGTVRVKGQQNGDLPSWLIDAAAAAGISEVYDNRHQLAENPKRPHFKATTGGNNAKGFWPPK